MPSALRAAATALANLIMWWFLCLALIEAAFETTLPLLFLMRSSLVSPPLVLTLLPRNTENFAILPLATWDFFMATFFMDFFIATFLATFMTFFIGKAMAGRKVKFGYGA